MNFCMFRFNLKYLGKSLVRHVNILLQQDEWQTSNDTATETHLGFLPHALFAFNYLFQMIAHLKRIYQNIQSNQATHRNSNLFNRR